jgi:hypothetical protein
VLTLAPGTRIIVDPATGTGSLVTADRRLWTLNPSAVTALLALQEGRQAAAAEAALAAAYPDTPIERVREDLDALLGRLQQHRVVVAA